MPMSRKNGMILTASSGGSVSEAFGTESLPALLPLLVMKLCSYKPRPGTVDNAPKGFGPLSC
jgi:hypothetical protein